MMAANLPAIVAVASKKTRIGLVLAGAEFTAREILLISGSS